MKTAIQFFAFFVLVFASQYAVAQTPVSSTALFPETVGQERTISGATVVSSYQEGIALTKFQGRYGMVNSRGYELVLPRFEDARLFHNGYAAVANNARWSFVNKQGQLIGKFRYEWTLNFEQGVAAVRRDGLWGFINEQGQEFVPCKYELVRSFNEEGVALALRKGQWYEIDMLGKEQPVLEASLIDNNPAF